jgi:hypothetical protein
MAAKIDKDFLKKNQFWIGLGGFVLLWLIAVVFVVASGGESDQKKKYDSALSGVKGKAGGVKTKAHEDPWVKYANEFAGRKEEAWKQAWELQKWLYEWPEGMRALEYPDDEFALDGRNKYRNDWYPRQYAQLEKSQIVAPAELPEGLKKVVPPQIWDDPNKNPENRPPTREEIWLAQEDFLVKREMLYIIRWAMDGAARFQEIEPPITEGLDEGEVARYKLKNTSWELDLIIKRVAGGTRPYAISEKSTIKNVHPSRRAQPLSVRAGDRGVTFRLWQGEKSAPVYFAVVGPLLAHNASVEFLTPTELTFNPKEPVVVDQIFEWENCPVRRVEALEVAYQSHRTATTPLKARPDLMALDPPAEGEEAKGDAKGKADTKSPAPPAGGQLGKAPPMSPQPGQRGRPGERPGDKGEAEGPTGPSAYTLNNQIPRERYLHVSDQCRHLPIAMRLVVDPAHVHDILGAVINSRLRIQITQVQLYRANGIHRPGEGKEGGPVLSGGGSFMPYMPGGRNGGMPERMREKMREIQRVRERPPSFPPAGRTDMMMKTKDPRPIGPKFRPDRPMGPERPMGLDPKGGESTAPAPTDPAPLVELTIYGIACLYERYPPKPKAAQPKGATPAPGKK